MRNTICGLTCAVVLSSLAQTPDESSLSIASGKVVTQAGAVGAFALPLRVRKIPFLPSEY